MGKGTVCTICNLFFLIISCSMEGGQKKGGWEPLATCWEGDFFSFS